MASFNELKNRIVTHLNYPNHIQIKPADIVLYPGPNEIRLFWGEDLLQDSQIELAASFNGEEIPVYVIKTLYNQVLLSVNLPEEDGIFEIVVTGKCIDSTSAISTCKNMFSSEVINIKNPAPPKFIQEPTILSNVYTRSILQNTGTLETATENIGFYFGNDPDSNQPGVFYKSEITEKIFLKLEFPFTNKIEGTSINFTINSLNEEFLNYLLSYYSEDFVYNKIINNTYTVNIVDIYNQYLFLVEPIFIDDDSGNSVFINLSAIDANIEYFYKSSSLTTTPWKNDNLFVKIINTGTYHSSPSNISISKIYNDGSIYKIGDFPIQRIDYGKHFYDERNISRPSSIPINYIGNLFNPDPTLYNEIWTRFGGSINITNNGGLYNSLTLAYDTEATTKKYSSNSNNIFLYPIDCYQNKFFKISFNYWTISQGTLQFYFENSETSSSELIFEINTELNSGVSSWEYTFDSTAFHGSSFKEIKLYWNGATPISLSDLSIVEEYELGPSYWLNVPLTENIRGESYNLQYTWLGTSNQSLNQQDNINSNTGNPTYIFGEDNTILGDLWVNDGYDTRGIQIHSDAAASWIGSVGYQGRNVAQTQGIGGWLIWSGAVGQPYNPIDNPHYKGIGMELHAGMNSGALRFFTDPATNTGLLELTGSIYAENGYFSGELQATTGNIAGLYIKDRYLQNDNDFYNSTLMVGSDSTMWNTPAPAQRLKDLAIINLSSFQPNRAIHTTSTINDYYGYKASGIPHFWVNITGSATTTNNDLYNSIALYLSTGALSGPTWVPQKWDTQDCDIIHVGTSIQRYWTSEYSPDYPSSVELKVDFYSNSTYLSSQKSHLKNVDPVKNDWSLTGYSKSFQVPTGANKFGIEYIFYKGIDGDQFVVDVADCEYRINSLDITGEKAYVELSPSGFLYRFSEDKFIKLGKDSFDIKGTIVEADSLKVEDQVLIGSSESVGWDQNPGLLNIRQTDTTVSSSIFSSFQNYRAQNWIGLQGAYNWNIENDQTEKYAWYDNNKKVMYYDNNSLYVSGAIFSRDKFGGLTNSGEVLTFSKTVTSAAGITALPTINYNTGSIDLIGGAVRIYDNSEHKFFMQRYEMPNNSLTLTNHSINYIIVSGSYGKPTYQITTDVDVIEESQNIPVLTAYREDDNVYYIDWDSLGRGLPNKLHQRLVKTNRFARESGLAIGVSGSAPPEYLTLTEGKTWIGAVRHKPIALNSLSDSIRRYYHSNPTTWTYNIVNSISNLYQYDTGTGLADVGPNKFAVLWVFRFIVDNEEDLSEKWAIVPSIAAYGTETVARSSAMPNLPDFISKMAILVGRIIIEQIPPDLSKVEVESAFSTSFSFTSGGGTVSMSHQDLDASTIQGNTSGVIGAYNHLTSSEYTGTGTGDFVRKDSPTLNGTVTVSGTLTATNISETSDERLKENIKDLESQLFNIYKLSPKRFNFISNIDKKEIGLIAQEVAKVYPELIVKNGEYYSIEYSKLTTILISGIKELIDENIKLQDRVQNLEESVKYIADFLRNKKIN